MSKENYLEYKRARNKFDITDTTFFNMRNLIVESIALMLVIFGIYLLRLDLITLGTFMIVYSNRHAFFYLTRVLGNIANYFTDISVALERINELYTDEEYKIEHFGKRKLKNISGRVDFVDVEYAYPEFKERDKAKIDAEKKYNKKIRK